MDRAPHYLGGFIIFFLGCPEAPLAPSGSPEGHCFWSGLCLFCSVPAVWSSASFRKNSLFYTCSLT